jgi:hypothetical protein
MAFGGPNQTATPQPVVDFTPQKDYLSFSGIINQYIVPAVYANAGGNTLTVADVLGGFITHTAAGAQTDTLPSAALLVPQIQGAQGPLPGIAPPVTGAGSSIRFLVKAGGAGTITIAVGAGGTAVGTMTVATLNVKEFLLVVTSSGDTPTYTVYSLGTSVY